MSEERLRLLRLRRARAIAQAKAEQQPKQQPEEQAPERPTLENYDPSLSNANGYAQDVLNAVTALPRGAATLASGGVKDIGHLTGNEWLYNKGREAKQYFLDDEAKRQDNMQSLPLTLGSSMLTGGTAATGLKTAATLGGRIAQGGGLGFLFGGVQPARDDDQQVMNTVLSTGFGGGLPLLTGALGKLYQGGKNLIEPWFEGGTENMAARTAQKAAGDQKAEIIQLLEANKQLPKGQAGAGEVSAPSGNAVFPALQRNAERSLPTEFDKSAAADNTARVATLRGVGGTADELDTLIASNKAQGAVDYPAAFNIPVTSDPTLAKIFKNPFVKKAISDISDLAEHKDLTQNGNFNKSVKPENLTEFIHQLKVSMDESLQRNAKTAASKFEAGAVKEARDELLAWLIAKNPLYGKARTNFGTNMQEINKRQVMQGLENKLVPAKDDMVGAVEDIYSPQSTGSFGNAMRNDHLLIKNSTGNPRSQTLRGVVGDEGVAATEQVAESLTRRKDYEQLAQRGSTAATDVLGAVAPNPPNSGMISQKYSVFKTLASALQGKVRGESLELLNQAMRDPARAAELLKRVVPADQQLIFRAMTDLNNATIAGQAELTKQVTY